MKISVELYTPTVFFRRFIATCCLAFLTVSCTDQGPSGDAALRVTGLNETIAPQVDPRRSPFPAAEYFENNDAWVAPEDASELVRTGLLPALQRLGAFGNQQTVFLPFRIEGDLPSTARAKQQLDNQIGMYVEQDGKYRRHPSVSYWDPAQSAVLIEPELGQPVPKGAQVFAGIDRPALHAILGDELDIINAPLSEALASQAQDLGLDGTDLFSATVYAVQDPIQDLQLIAQWVDEQTLQQPRFDGPTYGTSRPLTDLFGMPEKNEFGRTVRGGLLADNIATVYGGHVTLYAWSAASERRTLRRDELDNPIPWGTVDVEFAITVPDCPKPAAGYPVVLAQHGLQDEKSFGPIVGNRLAQDCFATLAIDAVAHGSRAAAPADRVNNFTGAHEPDGWADVYEGSRVDQLYLIRPLVMRANLIDSAAAWLQIEKMVAEGLFKDPVDSSPLLQGSEGTANQMFVGQSMGAIVASLFLGHARYTKAGVVNVGPGNFGTLAEASAMFNSFDAILGLAFTLEPRSPIDRHWFGVSLLQAATEGADPANHAPYWMQSQGGSQAVSVLHQSAAWDQLIPNLSNAVVARSAGLPRLGPEGEEFPLYSQPETDLPASNTTVRDGVSFSSGLVVFERADHLMINEYCATKKLRHDPPYGPEPEEYNFYNPIEAVQNQIAEFFRSARDEAAPRIVAPASGVLTEDACYKIGL